MADIPAPRRVFGTLTEAQKADINAMTRQERIRAVRAGRWSYAQCCYWASRRPDEVPKINNEFFFISAFEPEAAEAATSHQRIDLSQRLAA